MANYLDMDRLAAMVRTKRGMRGLRETVREIGDISPSTLSRVENEKMPDMEIFLRLCDWLEVSPSTFLKDSDKANDKNTMATLDPSEEIAIQLRADKKLDPATANALAALVKAAYHNLRNDKDKRELLPDKRI